MHGLYVIYCIYRASMKAGIYTEEKELTCKQQLVKILRIQDGKLSSLLEWVYYILYRI